MTGTRRRRRPAEPLLALLALLVLIASCSGPVTRPSPTPTARPTPVPSASATVTASPAPSPSGRLLGVCDQQGAQECVTLPAVTQATVGSTICKTGWTATVRPPRSYTDALKRQQLAALHAQHPTWTTANTEEDHRLPLELGGDPRDPHNLSPEFADDPLPTAPVHNHKDDAENAARRAVCDQHQPLADVQFRFVAEWLMAWPDYRK